MPQRQSVKIHISEEVQGEGSWVKIRRLTVGQQAMFRAAMTDAEKSVISINDERLNRLTKATMVIDAQKKILQQNVIEWNWVDDDGAVLPLPARQPEVLDMLTDEEFLFLFQCIGGQLPQAEVEKKDLTS